MAVTEITGQTLIKLSYKDFSVLLKRVDNGKLVKDDGECPKDVLQAFIEALDVEAITIRQDVNHRLDAEKKVNTLMKLFGVSEMDSVSQAYDKMMGDKERFLALREAEIAENRKVRAEIMSFFSEVGGSEEDINPISVTEDDQKIIMEMVEKLGFTVEDMLTDMSKRKLVQDELNKANPDKEYCLLSSDELNPENSRLLGKNNIPYPYQESTSKTLH